MRIAVINFSGNTGKSTLCKHLLEPRLPKAKIFAVESINAGSADAAVPLRGKDFGILQEILLTEDSVIVDVGASNADDWIKGMKSYDGAHQDFDLFVVPTVKERKQQVDTVTTIEQLVRIGVEPSKIRMVFNRVDADEIDSVRDVFRVVFLSAQQNGIPATAEATILQNEIFDRLRTSDQNIQAIAMDTTDFRSKLRDEKNPDRKADLVRKISLQRLSRSAEQNLAAVFELVTGTE